MRKVVLILAILATAFHVYDAYGRDLKRNDPERKAILDSVRASNRYSYLSDSKFVVKKIWASDQWAYLCALVIDEHGRYQATDDQLDNYEIILSKRGGQWIPVADVGAFATSLKGNCGIASEKGISDGVLKSIVEDYKKKGF